MIHYFFLVLILIHSAVSIYALAPTQGACESVLVSCLPGRVERGTRVPHLKNIPIFLDGDPGDEYRAREEDDWAGHNYHQLSYFTPVSLES